METVGIHHVALNVPDVEEGIRFYTEVLGGQLRTDRPELGIAGAWIDLGAQQVHLVEAPVPRNLGQHFALRVRDLDAAVAELRAKGVELGDPSHIGSNRQTFVVDPAGNPIELHEVGEPIG
ncbi:MAG: VOC family protein [Acidimicrobiales bacterium]|nr:VOC family protein [Acidimicrobiales bacterium]